MNHEGTLDVLVDIHRPITAACFSRIAGTGHRAVGRRAVDVVGVVGGVRAAAPAFDGVLDTKNSGSGALRLANLRDGAGVEQARV